MITLNGNRAKQSIDDVLNELDQFEAETMGTAKPFTAFILDVDRQPEDPRIVHFETTSGAMMHGDIETAYFYECDAGKDDPDFETTGGADSIGNWWQHKGAAVLGVIAGHHIAAWNVDGMCNGDYDAAFNLAIPPVKNPFEETYQAAWISTTHITPRTLDGLNALEASDLLPFYIHPTAYGWIVRFDAFEQFGLAEDETNTIIKRLASAPDMVAIKEALYKHGIQAAHLDADGPLIDGLQEYDH